MNDNVTTTVDNFTIQNGYDNGDGGGILSHGTLTLTRSTVSYNYTGWTGGGIAVVNGSSANIIDTRIFSNTTHSKGGGIAVWDGSSVNIHGTKIYANTAKYGEGGGIYADSGHLNISRSWVVGNAAPDNDAGGIFFGVSAYIENSIIAGNTSASSAGGLQFGPGGPYHIVNSHIVGNYTPEFGSAIATWKPAQVILTNTLVISNTGSTAFYDKYGSGSEFLLNYCDTYGNSPDGTYGLTITRTNCLGTPPEDGLDPLMAGGALPSGVGPDYADEWLSYDYRLLSGSPAIDAGTLVDAPATDIEGTPRDATPDMGAYEFYLHYLTVSLAGTGSGSVSSTPTGISCSPDAGSDCTENFDYGTLVTLTATADSSSTFAGWSGDCSGSSDCAVTMTEAYAVTATFNLAEVYLPLISR